MYLVLVWLFILAGPSSPKWDGQLTHLLNEMAQLAHLPSLLHNSSLLDHSMQSDKSYWLADIDVIVQVLCFTHNCSASPSSSSEQLIACCITFAWTSGIYLWRTSDCIKPRCLLMFCIVHLTGTNWRGTKASTLNLPWFKAPVWMNVPTTEMQQTLTSN